MTLAFFPRTEVSKRPDTAGAILPGQSFFFRSCSSARKFLNAANTMLQWVVAKRALLCRAGGLEVPSVINSCDTYPLAGLLEVAECTFAVVEVLQGK